MAGYRQLPLPLSPSVAPAYANFQRGSNSFAVDMVQQLCNADDANQVYLWGAPRCGKTHLLLAAHNDYVEQNRRSFYVSLKEPSLSANLFESMHEYALLAVDDIDCIAGVQTWELALFNLINFSREQSGKILFAASAAPASAGWRLPDLQSRLGWGPVIKMEPLSDVDLHQTVLDAAEGKGLQMPDETIDYLLKRYSRDVGSLLQTVALLDRESLAAGRARITIPFLKSCLSAVED